MIAVSKGRRMKFTIVAVGKLKEKFWTAACAEYLKRMQPYGKTEVREIADVDPARAGGVDAARDREGAAILAALGPSAHVVLLAIDGKQRSSESFSQRIDALKLNGASDIAFVIGGSDGVSAAVRQPTRRCRSALSRCRTTWLVWCCWNSSTAPRKFHAASHTINETKGRVNVSSSRERPSPLSPE